MTKPTPMASALARCLAASCLWGLLCLPAGAAAQACAGLHDILAQAAAEYAYRQNLARAERAAALFRHALGRDPTCPSAAVGLARTLVWIGVLSHGERELQAYADAGQAAQQLADLRPEMVGGHYWLGVATALRANASGPLEGWQLAGAAQNSLTRALQLDPAYEGGGPHRVLGRLYGKMPTVIGGDRGLAEWHLRRALALGPTYWLNHLYLAALLSEKACLEEAKDLLRQVIAGGPCQGLLAEYGLWRQQAQELLSRLEGD